MNPRKIRIYPAIHRRIRELDLTYAEVAERMNITGANFSQKMTGKRPWHEPEMQRLMDEIAQPEETLADFFPRRNCI